MRSVKLVAAALAAAALSACAVTPPAPSPVPTHRPAAPLYHAAIGAPSCVAGSQGVAPSVTLTFTPPTTNLDGTPVHGPLTYNLYQGASSGSEVKTTSGITGSPIALSTGVKGGVTYYWELTAVDAIGNESPRSNEACKTFPASPPNAFVITIE